MLVCSKFSTSLNFNISKSEVSVAILILICQGSMSGFACGL